MNDRFADTNVLLYLTSKEIVKARVAERLLGEGLVISVQVMNEFANAGRRKIGLSWAEIHEMLDTISAISTVVPLTLAIHRRGLAIAERYLLATYDAMIVAAALEAGCDTLYSEDMQHGQMIEGRLRIANPFV